VKGATVSGTVSWPSDGMEGLESGIPRPPKSPPKPQNIAFFSGAGPPRAISNVWRIGVEEYENT
jgi:hypothetical protein